MGRIEKNGEVIRLLGDDFIIILEDLYPKDDYKFFSYVYVDAYRQPEAKILNIEDYEKCINKFKEDFKI